MNRIALTALLCSATYALSHKGASSSTSSTQVAAVSQIGHVSDGQMFLELPFTTYLYTGHGKVAAAKTSTFHTMDVWNDIKQCYEATLVPVSESVEPILHP